MPWLGEGTNFSGGKPLALDTDAHPGQPGLGKDDRVILPAAHLPDPRVHVAPEVLHRYRRVMAEELGTPAGARGADDLHGTE